MHRNKQKKGISTIIAAIFMVAMLVVGLNVMTYVSNSQNNLAQVQAQKNQKATERISEQLQFTGVTVPNNKFNITLYNTGSLPVHLVRMWVTNNTAPNWHQSWDLTSNNYYLNPRNSTRNIGQSLTPTLSYCVSCVTNAKPTYTFGFVTERGTIATYKLAGYSDAQLYARLIATPPTIIPGGQVSLVMLVENNNTLADAVVNITPPTTLTVTGSATCTPVSGPFPTSDPNILRGGTRSYTWTYQLSGNDGQSCTFQGSLTNPQSNTASVTATLKAVTATTNWSLTAGIITADFSSFRWTQGNAWHSGWAVSAGTKTAFNMTITNNNTTGVCAGGPAACTFWVSGNSLFNLGTIAINPTNSGWYIVNSVDKDGTGNPTNTAYGSANCGSLTDYCVSVAPGASATLSFAAGTPFASTQVKTALGSNLFTGTVLIYGKFSSTQPTSSTGTLYAQQIPFIAVSAT